VSTLAVTPDTWGDLCDEISRELGVPVIALGYVWMIAYKLRWTYGTRGEISDVECEQVRELFANLREAIA
jgi:hypothetical protein